VNAEHGAWVPRTLGTCDLRRTCSLKWLFFRIVEAIIHIMEYSGIAEVGAGRRRRRRSDRERRA
jgi:hypothetical protein